MERTSRHASLNVGDEVELILRLQRQHKELKMTYVGQLRRMCSEGQGRSECSSGALSPELIVAKTLMHPNVLARYSERL